MFRIFENGTEIGVADKLTFIKKADNGCFVLCAEDEAQGIAFNGETFTLGTNGGIENAREVQFCEVSTATEVQKAQVVTVSPSSRWLRLGPLTLLRQPNTLTCSVSGHTLLLTRWVRFAGIRKFSISVSRLILLKLTGHLTRRPAYGARPATLLKSGPSGLSLLVLMTHTRKTQRCPIMGSTGRLTSRRTSGNLAFTAGQK